MGRQLFLHHYLPAHLASALCTGGLIEFIFNIDPAEMEDNMRTSASATNAAVSKGKPAPKTTPAAGNLRHRLATHSLAGTWIATIAILAVVVWSFFYFAPLTYGSPGLTIEQVQARKWLNYDLHFAK